MQQQTHVVQEYLLHDEGGHSFRQLAADLHRAQAQRDDFRGEQEVDHICVVNLRGETTKRRSYVEGRVAAADAGFPQPSTEVPSQPKR